MSEASTRGERRQQLSCLVCLWILCLLCFSSLILGENLKRSTFQRFFFIFWYSKLKNRNWLLLAPRKNMKQILPLKFCLKCIIPIFFLKNAEPLKGNILWIPRFPLSASFKKTIQKVFYNANSLKRP